MGYNASLVKIVKKECEKCKNFHKYNCGIDCGDRTYRLELSLLNYPEKDVLKSMFSDYVSIYKEQIMDIENFFNNKGLNVKDIYITNKYNNNKTIEYIFLNNIYFKKTQYYYKKLYNTNSKRKKKKYNSLMNKYGYKINFFTEKVNCFNVEEKEILFIKDIANVNNAYDLELTYEYLEGDYTIYYERDLLYIYDNFIKEHKKEEFKRYIVDNFVEGETIITFE